MNKIKNFSVGAWITAVSALLTLAALIVYAVNINSQGYFQGASVSGLVAYGCVAAIAMLAAVALGQMKGSTGLELVKGALQIVAPVLLILCLGNLVAARAEGLAFIYMSNADVILEVQTPANLSSASATIANMVCLAVAALGGIVGAFCGMTKKTR